MGLATKYVNSEGVHVGRGVKKDKLVAGTPMYASANAHRGFNFGRRDDLEALGKCILCGVFVLLLLFVVVMCVCV